MPTHEQELIHSSEWQGFAVARKYQGSGLFVSLDLIRVLDKQVNEGGDANIYAKAFRWALFTELEICEHEISFTDSADAARGIEAVEQYVTNNYLIGVYADQRQYDTVVRFYTYGKLSDQDSQFIRGNCRPQDYSPGSLFNRRPERIFPTDDEWDYTVNPPVYKHVPPEVTDTERLSWGL